MEQNNSSLPKKNPLSMQIDLDKFAPATEEEKRQQDVMSKSTTFFRDGMRKLFKNPLAVGQPYSACSHHNHHNSCAHDRTLQVFRDTFRKRQAG